MVTQVSHTENDHFHYGILFTESMGSADCKERESILCSKPSHADELRVTHMPNPDFSSSKPT